MEFLEKLDAETLKEELLSFLEDGEEIVEITSLGEFEEQFVEYIKEVMDKLKDGGTEMDRLTERNPSWIDDELWESACEPDCEEIDAVYRKLKEYEDLEEQGRLVKLPCKVGNTVYVIVGKNISAQKIQRATIDSEGKIEFCTKRRGFALFDIGKTVFLTREEAEEKLKEKRGREYDREKTVYL